MDFPQDDLKWFGQGFDGFPKKLPEDVVEYVIFIVDSHLSDVQTRERLQAFQRALNALEKKFLKEYIWQRDALRLDLVREEGRWLLRGQTNYGDSVADEWLIVYLLRELSKEFKNAWIRIYDTDGEFLLIEAANALPNWLNPEVAENRVWINAHRLLIIPLGKGAEPAPLKQDEALKIILDTPARPQHYPKVEKEAFHRLNGYPAAISENQHHATLPLPRTVAHVLHFSPAYIASVVEAFYLRDPVSIRLLQPEKSRVPLVFPPKDFVNVSVRFTKVLYAQLMGQHWDPPTQWANALESLIEQGEPQERAEIGIKVAAGMEMLVKHTLYADRKVVREIKLLLEDLENGDDTLPTDSEISAWPRREDDEGWLDIDFTEFEKELAGKGGTQGFGDKAAQENLKKMVERFNDFLNDNEAGIEGAGVPDPMDVDNDSDADDRGWEDPEDSDESDQDIGSKAKKADAGDEVDEDDNDTDADEEFAEYEKTYAKFMTLSAAEKALLTEEARELALAQDAEQEEDEEIKKLSDMMQAELFGHGALNLNEPSDLTPRTGAIGSRGKSAKGKGKAKLEEIRGDDDDDDNDDDDDDYDGHLLDENYNLADNMLKAFKSQAGLAGPAGNMMNLMGIQFPQDADDEMKSQSSKGKEQRKGNAGEGGSKAAH